MPDNTVYLNRRMVTQAAQETSTYRSSRYFNVLERLTMPSLFEPPLYFKLSLKLD